MHPDHILEVRNLCTYFDIREGIVKAVDGVSFDLKKGKAIGLVGESGCGKTTTALSIIRLLGDNGYIADGSILFEDRDMAQLNEDEILALRWQEISMIFQGAMNALNPVMKISRQITEAIILHGESSEEQAFQRAKQLFDLVKINPNLLESYPHEFSGGMRQRAIIAMALACDPKLIIGDEPTTALDVMVQAQILDLINELRRELHMSMIMITHDLSIISETCDQIAIMYAGKIVEMGDVNEVIMHYRHPYTEKLIRAFPNIYGERRMVESIPGAPMNLLNPPSGCRFEERCHKKIGEICRQVEPSLESIGKNSHLVACHLFNEDSHE